MRDEAGWTRAPTRLDWIRQERGDVVGRAADCSRTLIAASRGWPRARSEVRRGRVLQSLETGWTRLRRRAGDGSKVQTNAASDERCELTRRRSTKLEVVSTHARGRERRDAEDGGGQGGDGRSRRSLLPVQGR